MLQFLVPVLVLVASAGYTAWQFMDHETVQRQWSIVHKHAEYEDGFNRGLRIGASMTAAFAALAWFLVLACKF